MRTRLLGVVLVVLAAVSSGCGGDGDDGDAAPTTTSTTVDESDASQPAADDQARAESIVLSASDLPEDVDWTSTPWEHDEEGERALRTCIGLPPPSDVARADSPTFSAGDVTTVDSSASIASSAESVNEVFAAAEGPKFVDCVRQRVEAQLDEQPDQTFGSVRAERLQFPHVGDGTTAVRASTTIESADGEQVPLHLDVVIVKKGTVGMTLGLVNAPEPFPTELAVALAEVMAARA